MKLEKFINIHSIIYRLESALNTYFIINISGTTPHFFLRAMSSHPIEFPVYSLRPKSVQTTTFQWILIQLASAERKSIVKEFCFYLRLFFAHLQFPNFCGLFCSIYFGEYNLLWQQIGPRFLWQAHKYKICFSWHSVATGLSMFMIFLPFGKRKLIRVRISQTLSVRAQHPKQK